MLTERSHTTRHFLVVGLRRSNADRSKEFSRDLAARESVCYEVDIRDTVEGPILAREQVRVFRSLEGAGKRRSVLWSSKLITWLGQPSDLLVHMQGGKGPLP